MKKIYYKKLVRDKIPQVIAQAGGESKINKLNNKDFKKELLRKIGEESNGVMQAKTKKEIISELGDLVDVIDEVKKSFSITEKQIKETRKNAFIKKGGFKKKIFLVWSSDTGYKSNENSQKGK